jgi:spore germination protein GerM
MKVERYRLAALIVICILVGGLLAYGYRVLLSSEQKKGHEPSPGRILPKLAKARAHLYFLDEDHRFLKAEERSVTREDSAVERARSIVHALIDGPRGELLPTVPKEARLLSLFLTEEGVSYVNFDRAVREKHSGGSLSELFTIFSIVNTLTLNIPEIESVKILIEGREEKTLAGHIDIRFPFQPNMLMIK